ncbi:MAG: hypothetical protein ACQESR_22465 [Planctomycetota bacterium]
MGPALGLPLFPGAAGAQNIAFEKQVLRDEAHYCDGISRGGLWKASPYRLKAGDMPSMSEGGLEPVIFGEWRWNIKVVEEQIADTPRFNLSCPSHDASHAIQEHR